MKTYTKEELAEVLRKHRLWVEGKEGGERANLSRANLSRADLSRANLSGANLSWANLSRADLSRANLYGAGESLRYFILPEEGEFIAWKSVRSKVDAKPVVLKLRIPADAERACSYVGRKCRVSRAVPIAAFRGKEPCEETEFVSDRSGAFVYRLGEEIVPDSFDPDPRVECTNGLHIFITRQEAEEYLF